MVTWVPDQRVEMKHGLLHVALHGLQPISLYMRKYGHMVNRVTQGPSISLYMHGDLVIHNMYGHQYRNHHTYPGGVAPIIAGVCVY